MEKINGRREISAIVFDSGIGGLNLLCACARLRPDVHYYYVSDNTNVPYGNRSGDEIFELVIKALDGIEALDPSALVVACNIVTAQCIDRLRARYSFSVIGIQPAVKQAAKTGGRCLVLATESTVNSEAFKNLLARFAPPDTVAVGCVGLAEYVEQNIYALPEELPQGLLPDETADCVVLGCTHYAFASEQIKRRYNCPVYDGIEGTARHFYDILGKNVHFYPQTGIFDHQTVKKFKITYLRGDCVKNKQIFEYLFNKSQNKK